MSPHETFYLRHAIALRDGSEYVRGDVTMIVVRSRDDAEALGVLTESLVADSPLSVADFELLAPGDIVGVMPVATVITAYENDPALHEALAPWGAQTLHRYLGRSR